MASHVEETELLATCHSKRVKCALFSQARLGEYYQAPLTIPNLVIVRIVLTLPRVYCNSDPTEILIPVAGEPTFMRVATTLHHDAFIFSIRRGGCRYGPC